jgi:hypothetical protein
MLWLAVIRIVQGISQVPHRRSRTLQHGRTVQHDVDCGVLPSRMYCTVYYAVLICMSRDKSKYSLMPLTKCPLTSSSRLNIHQSIDSILTHAAESIGSHACPP